MCRAGDQGPPVALQMEGKAGWTLAQGEEGKGRGTGLFIEFHFILPFLLPFIHSHMGQPTAELSSVPR